MSVGIRRLALGKPVFANDNKTTLFEMFHPCLQNNIILFDMGSDVDDKKMDFKIYIFSFFFLPVQ